MSREKQIEEMALSIHSIMPIGLELSVAVATDLYSADYRKQVWISVEDRLPEDVYKDRKTITVLVCTKSGRVSTSSRVRMMKVNKEKMDYEYTDIFEWSGQIAKKITHWMPLPEAPKGGAE